MSLSDTEIARTNVLRNVIHTVGAKKTGAINCVSEEIIVRIINSLRV